MTHAVLKNQYMATVASLVIRVLGVCSCLKIPRDLLPIFDTPTGISPCLYPITKRQTVPGSADRTAMA